MTVRFQTVRQEEESHVYPDVNEYKDHVTFSIQIESCHNHLNGPQTRPTVTAAGDGSFM